MRVLLAGLVALASSHSIAGELPREGMQSRRSGLLSMRQKLPNLLAPLQRKEPYAGVAVTRDERHGSDERYRLDVCRPNNAASALPVHWIVTNVYEKIGDRWLTVSHYVQPRPQ